MDRFPPNAAGDDEGLSEPEDEADHSAMNASAMWSSALHDSVFNPAAHSWIIVPPADDTPQPASTDAPASEEHSANHVLERVAPHVVDDVLLSVPLAAFSAASLPSPAVSEIAHLVEGARAPVAPVLELVLPGRADMQLPDGVPAWTQLSPVEHFWGSDPVVKDVSEQSVHSDWEPDELKAPLPLGHSFNWSDASWKWRVFTNAASLLVGVYLGSACCSPRNGSSAVQSSNATSEATPVCRAR